jgi:hypothetical protein
MVLVLEGPVEAARDRAEEELLVGVFSHALSVHSGSEGFSFENIVGVAIGERSVSGRPTGELAVKVYVVTKAAPENVDANALIPSGYDGVRTDVVETGEFVAHSNRGRFRPSPSGVSLAHYADTAGTFGFVAERHGSLFIVSNNHVLARENDAAIGDPILQPGPADGGDPASDTIGSLAEFFPLDFAGGRTIIDAALAETEANGIQAAAINGLGPYLPQALTAQRG